MNGLLEFIVDKVEPMIGAYGKRRTIKAFEYATLYVLYAYKNQKLEVSDIIKLHDGNLYIVIEIINDSTVFVCLTGNKYILEKNTKRLLGEGVLTGKATIKD